MRTMTAINLENACEYRYGWVDTNEFHYIDDTFYVDDYEDEDEFIEDVLATVRYYQ